MNKNLLNRKSLESPAQRSAPILVIVSLLALASMVCQCTPGANPSANPNSNGSLTDAEELQAVERANEVYHQSMDSDGVADMVQLLNYLGSDPAFEAYGPSSDGSVWAQLTNGRQAVFLATAREVVDSSTHPAAGLAAPFPIAMPEYQVANDLVSSGEASARLLTDNEKLELPSNDLVLIMNGLTSAYSFNSGKLADWFDLMEYAVVPPSTGVQVEDLYFKENGNQYGVFILATHGGLGCREIVNKQCTVPLALLATNTLVTEENKKRYADDLDARRLVFVGSRDYPGNYYAFTETFVIKHMLFPANSLVFLYACSGSNMAFAFSIAHASVVLGWDDALSGGTTSQDYFFDRMLGINEVPAKGQLTEPEPPNRPFDYLSVYNLMAATYQNLSWAEVDVYGLDPDGRYKVTGVRKVKAQLISYHGEGSFGILRPTIEHLEVDEENEKLIIVGVFGSEVGEVYMNDTQLEATWGNNKIEVDLPAADDSNGTGLVSVKVRQHESNAVPLTLWHVKFTYTEGPEQTITAYQWLDLDIYWRADVHMYRSLPDGMRSNQGTIEIEPAKASTAMWRCQWDGSYAGISFTTESGEGSLTLTYDGAPDVFTEDGTFSSTGTLDGVMHQIVDLQFIVNYDPETTCLVKSTGYGVSSTSAFGFVLLPGLLRNVGDTPALEPLLLEMTGGYLDYTLPEAMQYLTHDGMWPTLDWKDTVPEYAPIDKETEG